MEPTFGYQEVVSTSPALAAYQRGGAPVLGVPRLEAEWEEAGDRYLLLALYTPERTLRVERWDAHRQRWEEVIPPPAFRFCLAAWADALGLPLTLPPPTEAAP